MPKKLIFKELVFVFGSNLSQSRAELINTITSLGGMVVPAVTQRVTHLVCDSKEASNSKNSKVLKAKQYEIHIVTEDFITESVAKDELQDEEYYVVDEKYVSESSGDDFVAGDGEASRDVPDDVKEESDASEMDSEEVDKPKRKSKKAASSNNNSETPKKKRSRKADDECVDFDLLDKLGQLEPWDDFLKRTNPEKRKKRVKKEQTAPVVGAGSDAPAVKSDTPATMQEDSDSSSSSSKSDEVSLSNKGKKKQTSPPSTTTMKVEVGEAQLTSQDDNGDTPAAVAAADNQKRGEDDSNIKEAPKVEETASASRCIIS